MHSAKSAGAPFIKIAADNKTRTPEPLGKDAAAASESDGAAAGADSGASTLEEPTVLEARKQIGSKAWAFDADRPPYPPNTNKCNLFVYEALNNSGKPVAMNERFSFRRLGNVQYPPLAGQWADPDAEIPGWKVVTEPKPGDVAAIRQNYSDASGHVAIVSGDETTVSATGTEVVENDWGFREGQKPVFRRYVGDQ